jgi:hypothetical protein
MVWDSPAHLVAKRGETTYEQQQQHHHGRAINFTTRVSASK